MGKRTLLCLVTAFLLLTAGCSTLTETINSAVSGVQDGISSTDEALSSAAIDAMGMEGSMTALAVYSQIYMAGGYAQSDHNFKEGEGVTFIMTSSKNKDEKQTVFTKKALLKNMDNGSSWWALSSWGADQERINSEALMSEDSKILKFRYKDSDGNVQEWIPDEDSQEMDAVEDEMHEGSEADYSDLSKGTEKITVPAGTFKAEHFLVEDKTEGEDYVQEWWVNEDVPGKMIKYIMTDKTEGITNTGELESTSKGNKTQLTSY